ncbi:MAG: MFS transporter [Alphaproteobacteria bacterium]|nr:MFS transporter [Alphaproteobacteria bacterium]MBU2033456.1 MFS transporter [Alphaproteobacteria bacterium]MBU2341711.1 MFS transporter [Alphaproteobacteria bacterium]
MTTTTRLLSRRRFLPLFCTQLLNAFNDNLYKTAMVLFVVYSVYNSEESESMFSGIASALFIIPFVLFSAIAGQLADMRDKARIIRTVKLCEFGIMTLGAIGLFLAWRGIAVDGFAIPLMLFALFLAGVQSTFLGPIKYAILPQHLRKREVLAGTGLVEAGTYVAILAGTILAGVIPVEYAAALILATAVVGYLVSRQIPDAPPIGKVEAIDWNVLRSSIRLISGCMHDRQVWYAILAISFFWTIGAVLFIQFPPLAKNVLMASKEVASLFLVMFSIGIAIGSVSINALLKNEVSARYAPASVIVMGMFVIGFYLIARSWTGDASGGLLSLGEFVVQPMAALLLLSLLGIAIAGGMFVVPLYAFLTTRVAPEQASRTIAANNIVNSFAMVGGSLLAMGLTALGMAVIEQVLLSAAMCLISAWLGSRLYRIERAGAAEA